MNRLVVLFEDHTCQRFRPVAWSVPVYEIACGLFNLRERVALARASGGGAAAVGLLPRALLGDLQRINPSPGAAIGADAVAAACAEADDVLWLSARCRGERARLAEWLDGSGPPALRDGFGPVAFLTPPERAAAVLASWREWEADQAARGAWTEFDVLAAAWDPVPDASAATSGDARSALWELVPDIGPAVEADVADVVARGIPFGRRPFGLAPLDDADGPVGAGESRFAPWRPAPGATVDGEKGVWAADGVDVRPGVVIDVRHGPVALDRDVTVLPHAYLQGPLYLGAGTRVKAAATLYGETAAGDGCRLAGEIAESQLAGFVNKQHAGFLGHAVIASWVNLGADTTCSDLKNNYGEIAVNAGLGPLPTGSRFVGLAAAEHVKSAIGTVFNTGTTVGFASNVFAAGFPASCLPNFTWGDGAGDTRFLVDRALETARIVMSRRGCRLTPAHEALFRALAVGDS